MDNKNSILVVDDTQSNLDILVDLLKMYNITVALDGETAVEMTKHHSFDLILLDIMMPVMDGFEVCKYLKSDPLTKSIPVIFITAKTDEESIENAFLCGGVDYVTKPFKSRELLSRIHTQLTLKRMVNDLESLVEDEISKRQKQEKLLQQQSKMAAMGEMMDAVAHQWKQPLNALSLYSDIIPDDFANGIVDQIYVNEFKTDVQIQIAHMVDTLDEFRTFFRPNKKNTNFTLQDVINSVLILIKDEFMKNAITVNVAQQDTLKMYGSENELKHLLLNILNNAKDAFADNSVKNKIITIRLMQINDRNVLEIEDNAGGIPTSVLPDIFKANVTSKSEGKGTGIGLYMSHQIAQKHAATLSAKNQNEGACFSLHWFLTH
ncbi:MAG: hypothetical protein DRG09_02360 [Epsilonproteobacteria bacterium]|nr:MAG: hypothetical protein DRG09_02360 [Campylobacterota bacterium]